MTRRAIAVWAGALLLAAGWCLAAVAVPTDAKIIPLGELGTVWQDLEPGVRGGTLNSYMLGNPQTWNPITAVESSSTLITNQIYRGLVSINPRTGLLEGDLAKDWEVSEDNLHFTFHLRQGLQWSDGEPFTADDVVFTFNDLILNPEVLSTARDSLVLPDGSTPVVTKVDDYTVEVTVSSPFRPLLILMAKRILPRHCWAESVHALNPEVEAGTFNGVLGLDTDPARIVGMGPYLLEQFVADQYVVLIRNPYYYAYDSKGTQLPYYDREVIQIVADHDTALLEFMNRQIDAFDPYPEDLPVLASRAAERGFTLLVDPTLPTYGTAWICANQDVGLADGSQDEKRELYRDQRFREALAYLVDRQAMIDALFHGLAVPQWSPVSMPSPFYADRTGYGGELSATSGDPYPYDPARAAALLDELGIVDRDGDGWRDFPGGDRVDIQLSTAAGLSEYEGECLIFVDRAHQVGLHVEYVPVDANTLLVELFTGGFDMAMIGFTGSPDPNSLISVYGPCGRLHVSHLSGCDAPTATEQAMLDLFASGAATLDDASAFQIYKKLQLEAAADASFIYTVYPCFRYGYYNYVGNAQMANPNATPTGENGFAADIAFDRRLGP
jgi:peptide/nickel transport system substrate-binding protein